MTRFYSLWTDFETSSYQLFGFDMLSNSFLLRTCFQVLFLLTSALKFQRVRLATRGFHMGRIAKCGFARKSFVMGFGVDFYCFLEALGATFLVPQ